jgi:hypothetical protein
MVIIFEPKIDVEFQVTKYNLCLILIDLFDFFI